MQGYTEAEYRRAHAEVYGAGYTSYTPFLRIERGEVAQRGVRDALATQSDPAAAVPQIIVGSVEEFDELTGLLKEKGFRSIDINMGCPFPPQVRKGRGAGLLTRLDVVEVLAERIAADSKCRYSVKMRTGVKTDSDWRPVLDILNGVSLRHVTVHPRIAADQYRGRADRAMLGEFIDASVNPVVYNGDVDEVEDIIGLASQYPALHGVMAGRGLLARPSLFAEVADGREWDAEKRADAVKRLHGRYRELLEKRVVGGEHQLLAKLKPFWEYLEPAIGRKSWKAIHKSTSMAAYDAAVVRI